MEDIGKKIRHREKKKERQTERKTHREKEIQTDRGRYKGSLIDRQRKTQ